MYVPILMLITSQKKAYLKINPRCKLPFKECFVYAVAYIQIAKSQGVAKSEKGL